MFLLDGKLALDELEFNNEEKKIFRSTFIKEL